jgi:hypothetical protein
MIKRSILLAVVAAFLIGTLLYRMSPGKVTTFYNCAMRQLSDAAVKALAALHLRNPENDDIPSAPARAAKTQPPRSLMPDPFRPYGPRPVAGGISVRTWLLRTEWLWCLADAGAILWLRRHTRRKKFQFGVEKKMAATLS